jgi:flagellar hook-associated protein 1 FlgK
VAITNILGVATSGLSAAQAAIDTISNNVSNANTPGYTRQRINLTTNSIGKALNGVSFSAPQRIAERFKETAVYTKAGDAGFDKTTNNYLTQLQSMMGSPDSEAGINATLNRVQSAAIGLNAPAAGQQASMAFITSIGDSLRALQQFDADLRQLRLDSESEVSALVPQINQLLGQIHKFNQEIGGTAPALRSNADIDQRNLAIQQLSEFVSISVTDNPNGTVTLMSGSGTVLLDQRLRQLTYSRSYDGGAEDFASINVNFSTGPSDPGTPTGQTIASSAIGGKLGALISIRDVELPALRDELGAVASGLAEALNRASNKGSAAPAPQSLAGRNTGLSSSDKLNFTGAATFAVTDTSGRLIKKTTIDFGSLGAGATIQTLVDQLNTDLNVAPGFTSATFSKGVLTLSAGSSAYGVAVVDDSAAPASRGGAGFSEYFGLNDLVRSSTALLVPSGVNSSDSHKFTGSTDIMLRDQTGRILGSQTIDFDALAGPTFQDVVNSLNSGTLSAFGTFSLRSDGQFAFAPVASALGARITVPRDTSQRADTAVSFGAVSGFLKAAVAPQNLSIRKDISVNPGKLPSAILDASAAIGSVVLGNADRAGFASYLQELDKEVAVGTADPVRTQDAIANMVSKLSLRADLVKRQADNSDGRLTDAINRRDAVSGVNVDEELAQLVVYQNSYAAAARLISTTSQMYDTLLSMMR